MTSQKESSAWVLKSPSLKQRDQEVEIGRSVAQRGIFQVFSHSSLFPSVGYLEDA